MFQVNTEKIESSVRFTLHTYNVFNKSVSAVFGLHKSMKNGSL